MIRSARAWTALSLAAVISGCSATDPYERPHVWRPTGANEANLAAMLANPADFARGRGLSQNDGTAAAAAVNRRRNDQVKPLIGANTAAAAAAVAGTPLTSN